VDVVPRSTGLDSDLWMTLYVAINLWMGIGHRCR